MGGTQVNELERQASEASLRALAEQEDRLRDLRSRAGALMTAATLSASFLGSRAPLAFGGDLMTGVAVGAFIVALVSALYVLAPREGLVFALDGAEIYAGLWGVRHDADEIHRRLAYWAAWYRASNQLRLSVSTAAIG